MKLNFAVTNLTAQDIKIDELKVELDYSPEEVAQLVTLYGAILETILKLKEA